jgi:hypothetical protein
MELLNRTTQYNVHKTLPLGQYFQPSISPLMNSVAFSPQANYTDWAVTAGRQILVRIDGCRVISAAVSLGR